MIPQVVAHRGDMEYFPENTLAAFSSAKEKGADAIELDVHSSSDSFPVVCHDYTLVRTTNGTGAISKCSLQYIQKLDAGSWFNDKFRNERIPSLEEVFILLGRGMKYEIEIRSCDKSFLEKVVRLVRKYNLEKWIEFTSPHSYVLTWLKQKINTRTGMFVSTPPSWIPIETAQKVLIGNALLGRINVLHCPVAILSKPFVIEAQKVNILIHAADCDTEAKLQQAAFLGVDQLSTSRLSLALDYFKKIPSH